MKNSSLSSVLRNKGALTPHPIKTAAREIARKIEKKEIKALEKPLAARPKGKPRGRRRALKDSIGTESIGLSFGKSMKALIPKSASTGLIREFVADLASTNTTGVFTTLQVIPLNPGNNRLFSRCSMMADLYSEYRFKSLAFYFQPTTSVTTNGSIGMYIGYDPTKSGAASMAALMANESAEMGPVYAPLVLRLDPKTYANRWYYTDPATADTATALDRQNDPGDFRLCIDKMLANVAFGYLFVEGEIEFRTPKSPASAAFSAPIQQPGTIATQSGPSTTTYYMNYNLSAATNRGFSYEVRLSNVDSTVPNFVGYAYDIVTNSNGSAVYSVSGFLPLRITIGGASPSAVAFTFRWYFRMVDPTGSVQNILVTTQSASGLGVGVTDYTLSTPANFTVTCNSGCRMMNYVECECTAFSGTGTISYSLNDPGYLTKIIRGVQAVQSPVPRFPSLDGEVKGDVLDPARNFLLPAQFDDAVAFLETLNGPISVSLLSSGVDPFSISLDDELLFKRFVRFQRDQCVRGPATGADDAEALPALRVREPEWDAVSSRSLAGATPGPRPPLRRP